MSSVYRRYTEQVSEEVIGLGRDRVSRTLRVDEDLFDRFEKFADRHDLSKARAEEMAIQRLLEDGPVADVEEQVQQNADRLDDVDAKLDEVLARLPESESEHTRTTSDTVTDAEAVDPDTTKGADTATATPLTDAEVHSLSQGEKAERIVQYIRENHLGDALSESQLRDYCDEVAGVGDRSFDSYRTLFKNKALCFEDPRQDTDYWYLDRAEFFAILRETRGQDLDTLREYDTPDDVLWPDVESPDLDIVDEYGGAIPAAYRAYRVAVYLDEDGEPPFEAGRIIAIGRMFESALFDTHPVSIAPEQYPDLLERKGYLVEQDDAGYTNGSGGTEGQRRFAPGEHIPNSRSTG